MINLKKIKKYLLCKIKIKFIEIYNDSIFHNHSKNALTHLRITIVSNDFIDQKLINRHRMIFSRLSEITKEKIYSITLNTYTVIEWKNKKNKNNKSSICLKNINFSKMN